MCNCILILPLRSLWNNAIGIWSSCMRSSCFLHTWAITVQVDRRTPWTFLGVHLKAPDLKIVLNPEPNKFSLRPPQDDPMQGWSLQSLRYDQLRRSRAWSSLFPISQSLSKYLIWNHNLSAKWVARFVSKLLRRQILSIHQRIGIRPQFSALRSAHSMKD